MKFERYFKKMFHWSARREAALKSTRKKILDKAPLFADQLDGDLCTVDQQRDKLEAAFYSNMRKERDLLARQWRRGRKLLGELPGGEREAFLRIWNGNRWTPKKALYLLDSLHQWVVMGKRPMKHEVIKYGLQGLNYGYSLLGDGTIRNFKVKPTSHNRQKVLFSEV